MGYYTNFTLTVKPQWLETQKPLKELVTEVQFLSEEEAESMKTVTFDVLNEVKKEFLASYSTDTLERVLDDSCKWYEWETDMKIISEKYPEVFFTLIGFGEENSDMWCAYFQKGKVQICKAIITYDEFDEEKLQ